MLWKKESEAKDALYIDLCKPLPNKIKKFQKDISLYEKRMLDSIERDFISNKDDGFSLKLRQEGNALFAKKKWHQAMDKYNRSLCYAESDSGNVAFAYANRSSCYLRMKMYDKCLIDIELAKKANYPKHLNHKLEKRVMECKESKEDSSPADSNEAKLSYESHKDCPGMASNLRIVSDSKYGRGVVTTKDIDVGETVVLEKMYFGESYVRKYETCTVCLKSNINLVPCGTCTFALRCYDVCKNADLHRLECGIRKYPNEGDDFAISMIIPIIRSIFMAVKLFPNPFDLMKFVEETLASDPMELPTTIDDKSTYRAFLKVHKQGLDDIQPQHIHLFYKSLLGKTELAPYFSLEKYQRFFMHLIMHHVAVFKSNKITNKRLIGNVLEHLNEISYVFEDDCLGILNTYFNHSCAPNITFYHDNGSIVGKVIRPVIKGEQLFVSYFDNLLGLTWDDRQNYGDFGFQCDCFRCKSGVDDNTDFHVDSDMAFNADYIFLRRNFSPNRSYPDESKRKIVEEKCVRLLKECGRNEWSYSLEYVMQAYVAALERSTSSPIPKYHYLTNIVKKRGLNHTVDMFEQHIASTFASLFK